MCRLSVIGMLLATSSMRQIALYYSKFMEGCVCAMFFMSHDVVEVISVLLSTLILPHRTLTLLSGLRPDQDVSITPVTSYVTIWKVEKIFFIFPRSSQG